jgi:undecaprenyl-diphosphatase
MGKFVVLAIISAVIIIWGYRFVNMRFHIFKKYELFVLILNLAALYALAKTIQDAWAPESFMANFDVYVNVIMNSVNHANKFVTMLAVWVTTIGGTIVTTGLGIAIAVWMAFRKKWRSAAIALISIASTAGSLAVLKTFFMRARPDNAIIHIINDPSFPSGHAAMAAAFFIIVAYLAVRQVKSRLARELIIVFSVLAVIAVGLSRLVLNVHWVSDVVAGWGLGVFLATASILLVKYVSVFFKPDIIKK